MKRVPNVNVKQWLIDQEMIYLSVITVEEIYFGLAYKDARRQLEWFKKFLQYRCKVLPITYSIAIRAGTLRGDFRKQGITRTQADLLIAATAYEYNLVLATHNIRDFEDCGITLFNPFEY
jgi:predicted nucleic acid-binding protein